MYPGETLRLLILSVPTPVEFAKRVILVPAIDRIQMMLSNYFDLYLNLLFIFLIDDKNNFIKRTARLVAHKSRRV